MHSQLAELFIDVSLLQDITCFTFQILHQNDTILSKQ